MKKIPHSHELLYHIIIALVFTVQCNFFGYRYLLPDSPASGIASACFGFLVLFGLLIFFSLNRFLYSLFLICIFTGSGILSIFMYEYKVPVSENLFSFWDTAQSPWECFLNPPCVMWVLLLAAESLILSYNYIKIISAIRGYRLKKRIKMAIIVILTAVLGVTAAAGPSILLRTYMTRDIICSFFTSAWRYSCSVSYINRYEQQPEIPWEDALTDDSDLTMVLIIAQKSDASHFHCAGYERATTPLLDESSALTFTDFTAVSPYSRWTIASVFQRNPYITAEGQKQEKSLISFFRRNGFYTAWLSNQRFVSERHTTPITAIAMESDEHVFQNQLTADKKYSVRLDGDLLPEFDKIISRKQKKNFIVMHINGSDAPWDYHYPDSFRFFTPVLADEDQDTSYTVSAINSYDNTVLYTDYFLSEIYSRLAGENAVVIFTAGNHSGSAGILSDEKLPLIIWASEKYTAAHQNRINTLNRNRSKSFTHRNLFHSLLDCSGIQTQILNPGQSIFRNN